MARKQLVYGINDKPPLPILILAGAQHVLTLFGATTLVPARARAGYGHDDGADGAFIGCVYFGMGIATLIQTHPKLGSGLPIVQGSSFSFIPPIMTIIGALQEHGAGRRNAVRRWFAHRRRRRALRARLRTAHRAHTQNNHARGHRPDDYGDRLSLAPTAIQFNAANFWPVSLLVVVLVFFFSLVSKNKYFNIFAVLGSIVIAYLLCLALSLAGVFAPGHAAYINLQSIIDAPWLRMNLFMPWGAPKFSGLAIGAIAAGFFLRND